MRTYFNNLCKQHIKENYSKLDEVFSANIISFMKAGPLFEQTTLYSVRELRKALLRFKIAFWESLIKENK